MCTVTLSYDENNSVATEKLESLLSTGLFMEVHDDPMKSVVDYFDPSLFEDDGSALPIEKEYYTLEEARTILKDSIKEIYEIKDAI